MAVRLEASILEQYERFSRFNSPYPAHEQGRALDLYPSSASEAAETGGKIVARSPIAGTVRETLTVRAPTKPYAPPHDHLIVLECTDAGVSHSSETLYCRILHVEPSVDGGETIERGDRLGTLVRSGFFAPWVDRHLHIGFRPAGRNQRRAAGSLPIELEVDLTPLSWDGRGTVSAVSETAALIAIPTATPSSRWVGLAAGEGAVLEGGLPHYAGGLYGGCERPVSLFGRQVGTATGGLLEWNDVVVTANGEMITGLSLFCMRESTAVVKLIAPGHSFTVGTSVDLRFR